MGLNLALSVSSYTWGVFMGASFKRLVVLTTLLFALGAPAAHADGAYTDGHVPAVGSSDPGRSPSVLGGNAPAPAPHVVETGGSSDALPMTGADLVGLAAIGGGAIVAGSLLKWRARPRLDHA